MWPHKQTVSIHLLQHLRKLHKITFNINYLGNLPETNLQGMMNNINAVISSDWFLLSWQKWTLIAGSPRQSQSTVTAPRTANFSWVLSDGCLADVPSWSYSVLLSLFQREWKRKVYGLHCSRVRVIFLLAYPLPFLSQNLSCVNACHSSTCCLILLQPTTAPGQGWALWFCCFLSPGNSNQDEAVEKSPFRLPLLKLPSDKLWRIT